MNRQERRKLLRQLEKENKAIRKSPLYSVMKAKMDSLRGNGTDIDLLKSQVLADQANPEPICINFCDFNESLFQEFSTNQLRPIICYEQEADGSISKVIGNGIDYLPFFYDFCESTKKDFATQGKVPTHSELLIEAIKVLNFGIESLGRGFTDVSHFIFSKMPMNERIKDRSLIVDYWTAEYKGLRNLFMSEHGKGF